MKKSLFLTLIFCVVSLIAQEKADRFTSGSNDQTRDPKMDQMNYVPNEILVKFKDETSISAASKIKAAGISKVDQVLQKYEITSLERLFPGEKKPTRSKVMRAPNGTELKAPALDKIYRVTVPNTETPLAQPVNIHQIIEELKALPEIEYAEPNYIYSIDQLQPVGPELTADDLVRMQTNKQKTSSTAVVPNDPLYPQQWYIPAVKADLVWEQTTGDTTQVIAILDTGVDWTHPDLTNKIWRNWGEIPDNGIDDDGNGLIDDYMGWDYINNDNNPMDDNSHGTHVAGIAAAESNNGIGIAGVNWQAKVMPIKVFQSSGRGDAATITKGIIYAAQKGATVINMSFGSYARSMAMEDVLVNAYATTLLVAAAGNDGIAIGPCMECGPSFPAAFSFVMGIESPEASFSNYDQDGPTYSEYPDLLNYEIKAPGTNIISSVPKGNYSFFNGTSMSAPIVSALLTLYKSKFTHDNETTENIWIKFIQASEQYLNIQNVFVIEPKPELRVRSKYILDNCFNCDQDGRIDSGETIQLLFSIRNTGGQIDSSYIKVTLNQYEDATICNVVKDSSFIGSISQYATRNNDSDPIIIKINSNISHDRDIALNLYVYQGYLQEPDIQHIILKVENGEELAGVMDTVLVLKPNKLWLINESFRVGSNGHLIIKPGTKIKIMQSKNISVKGKVTAIGKPDSLIYIEGEMYSQGFIRDGFQSESSIYKYIHFSGVSSSFRYYQTASSGLANVYNCLITGNFEGINNFQNNLIVNGYWNGNTNGSILYNTFLNCIIDNLSVVWPMGNEVKYNNFVSTKELFSTSIGRIGGVNLPPTHQFNSFLLQNELIYANSNLSDDIQYFQNQYWGTIDNNKIRKRIVDFWKSTQYPQFEFNPKLSIPSEFCHAIIWKVLVNGKDAQDEVIEPVGVGKQRFDIYFNRAMNKTIIPQVSFGVRHPYNQQAVNEDGSWSEDGKIYTVYKTIKLTTGDGINRIRVAGAKEIDGWDFEIPVEDSRFEFVIAAASSASADFMATPGLGKVALEWNHNDLEDGLGYNMYRMEHINDSTLTQPVIINNSLITDTLFTDYSVVPNKKYYYYYKILRTNMAETDSSRVVSAVPFTASKGDANGDLSVNVLDITTIVAYLLNNNPQPFIFEAADVNSDGQINVLDIVGVVNLVLNVPQNAIGISMNKQVDLYLQNDTLFADSNVDIGAIQFDFTGIDNFEDIEVLDALKAFESGNSFANDTLRVIFYSMTGKSINPGQAIPLLKLKAGSLINEVIMGEPSGSSVEVNYIKSRIPDITANMNQTIAELGQNYPNPVNGYTTIPVRIYEPVDELILRVTNMLGQEVEEIRLSNPVTGENLINWNPKQQKGLLMYKLEIRQGNNRSVCPAKRMMVR